MIPKDLEGYDFIKALNEWMAAGTLGDDGDRRQWCIRPHRTIGRPGKIFVECDLGWIINGTIASVRKLARSAEEAVHIALVEFQRWERASDLPLPSEGKQ